MTNSSRIEIARHHIVDVGHVHFEGHFEKFPVFPAVSQLELVRDLLAKETGRDFVVKSAQRCKFLKLVRPGEALHISVIAEHGVANWTIRSAADERITLSKGQLTYDCL